VTTFSPDNAGVSLTRSSSWEPQDVAGIVRGGIQRLAPSVLARTDGKCLLYSGKVNVIKGEYESGKSWLALFSVKQEIEKGHHCVYIDFEDDAFSVIGRLQLLGVDEDKIVNQFHYIRPDEPIKSDDIDRLEELISDWEPTLVVVDGVTEVMSLHGLSLMSNDDSAEFQRLIPRPIAELGPAVLMIDHVTKNPIGRGKYAIGAQHKEAGVTASYLVSAIHRPTPGGQGLMKVEVTKDRPGAVRQVSEQKKHTAEFKLNSGPDGFVTFIALQPGTEFRPTVLMGRISQALQGAGTDGMTQSAVTAEVTGKRQALIAALNVLVAEGWATETKNGRSKVYRSVKPFVEGEQSELWEDLVTSFA
jgi:hypothetical protein